jgi:hypothetical protein
MRSDVFYGSDAGIRLQVFGYLGFVVESSCRKLAWDRHAVEYRETTIITTHNNSEGLGFCCHDEKCGVRGTSLVSGHNAILYNTKLCFRRKRVEYCTEL